MSLIDELTYRLREAKLRPYIHKLNCNMKDCNCAKEAKMPTNKEILFSIEEKLDKILELLDGNYKDEITNHVIISCDASIKNNPGGPSAIGFVIREPGKKTLKVSNASMATTNNQAEYDAVYEALRTFFNLCNHPGCEVEVRSDSQLVINHLNGEAKCQDPILEKKRKGIIEFIEALPVPIKFVWKPRNSTKDLQQANYLAQDFLKVPRH